MIRGIGPIGRIRPIASLMMSASASEFVFRDRGLTRRGAPPHVLHRRAPFTALGRIIEDLRESNIPILVEVRDWARLPGSFRAEIERKHEILR